MKKILLFFKKLKKHLQAKGASLLWASILFSLILFLGTIFETPPYLNFIFVVALLAVILSATKIFIKYNDFKVIKSAEEERFKNLVNYLGDGVIIYDDDFRIISINSTAEEMFGIKSEEILGRRIEPSMVKNQKLQALIQVIFSSLAPSINKITESDKWPQITEITLDEPAFELYTVLHRFFDRETNRPIFIKVVKDVSREKTIIKSKNEFIGVAAHQLRTPLTAINWSLESLRGLVEKSSKEVKESIEEMSKLASRALKITNDLLDATKIEEGKYSYNLEETNIVDLVEKVVATMASEAKMAGIKIYFNSSVKLLKVKADSMKFAAALSNLIDNAVRYNVENGKVMVSVEGNNNSVIITIKDTGLGISKEELPRIFEKMWRGKHSAQIDPNGSGLGLFIVKTIVESHGGRIEAESELKRGTTFTIALPLQERPKAGGN